MGHGAVPTTHARTSLANTPESHGDGGMSHADAWDTVPCPTRVPIPEQVPPVGGTCKGVCGGFAAWDSVGVVTAVGPMQRRDARSTDGASVLRVARLVELRVEGAVPPRDDSHLTAISA